MRTHVSEVRIKRPHRAKYDADDDFDCTYADFHFDVPEVHREQIALLRKLGAVDNPAEKWQSLLAALNSKDTSRPDVQRALKVGEQIMGQINAHFAKPAAE